KKLNKANQTKKRKKLTCCQRCRRRICIWIYRRIKRCIRKKMFGKDKPPQLAEFEIGGMNIDDIKDKLTKKGTKSVETIYRTKINKSTKSIPLKEKILNEFSRHSLIKPTGKIKSILDNLNEGKLYVGLSANSLPKITSEEMRKFRKWDEVLTNQRKFSFNDSKLDVLDIHELKKKFSITPSKLVDLNDMIEDYKKTKFSLTEILKNSNIDIKNLDKKNLEKLINKYKEQKEKRNSFVKQPKLQQLKSDLLVLPRFVATKTCTCDDVPVEPTDPSLPDVNDDASTTKKSRKRCCPYNFDGKLCKYVGDRYLCGYNHNHGTPEGPDHIIELQNNCRIHAGRLECGYIEPPYPGSRRPPGRDEDEAEICCEGCRRRCKLSTCCRKRRNKRLKKNALTKSSQYNSKKERPTGKAMSGIGDLKERNLYLGLSKASNLNLTSKEKVQVGKLAQKIEKKLRNHSIPDFKLDDLNVEELKKRYSLTPSKLADLRSMVEDYAKDKFSLTDIDKKLRTDLKNLDKEKLEKLIQQYKEQKRKRVSIVKQSKLKQFKSDLNAKISTIKQKYN
ncbi:unnamed protein product, partial [Leptidea sinapis]